MYFFIFTDNFYQFLLKSLSSSKCIKKRLNIYIFRVNLWEKYLLNQFYSIWWDASNLFKGTLNVISSDLPRKDGNVPFTTVPTSMNYNIKFYNFVKLLNL